MARQLLSVIPWTGLLHRAQLLLLLLLLLPRLLKLPWQGLCLAALDRPGENQVGTALQHLHLHVWRLDVWQQPGAILRIRRHNSLL
jgi:hypothetical protein